MITTSFGILKKKNNLKIANMVEVDNKSFENKYEKEINISDFKNINEEVLL